MNRLADWRLFFAEFRRTFRTTGAVLPSGPALARALASQVRRPGTGRRVLEVGPGTGAVTAEIVAALADGDRFDLVEINERFAARMRERFDREPRFQRVASQSNVIHGRIEELSADEPYDLIVSGLPLNNFAAAEVEAILAQLTRLLRPGGTLSFFEYIAIRRVKSVVSGRSDRQRLAGISRALDGLFRRNSTRRQWVLPNVPPAWVHHVTTGQG